MPEPPALQGTVQAYEMYMPMMSMGQWMVGAYATFQDPEDLEMDDPVATSGSCSAFDGGGASGGASLDAGPIAIVGGQQEVELTYDGGDYDAAGATGSNLFDSGQLVEFTGEGGPDVGPFSGALETPPDLEVVHPNLEDGFTVERSEDLVVTWVPHEGGGIHFELASGDVAIACSASDGDGELTVPAHLLELLPPASMMGGMIMMTRTVRSTVEADTALVALEAATVIGTMGSIQ